MAKAAPKTWVYTYAHNGERTVKFATYDQAFKRACDDTAWNRALPWAIENTADPDEATGFIGTSELHRRIEAAQKAAK